MSRRFVAATETALAELMTRQLDDLDLVALMIDGVHFGEHTCVVALGIDGVKHLLAAGEGSTENATLVTELVTGLRDRGLDVTRPILAVLDGAKALSRAVKNVFDKPLIQRCQQHKIRNVTDELPDRLRTVTERWMPQAYHAESALKAEGLLTELVRELDKTHPGAAASQREGMAETLTILRLGCRPPWPARRTARGFHDTADWCTRERVLDLPGRVSAACSSPGVRTVWFARWAKAGQTMLLLFTAARELRHPGCQDAPHRRHAAWALGLMPDRAVRSASDDASAGSHSRYHPGAGGGPAR